MSLLKVDIFHFYGLLEPRKVHISYWTICGRIMVPPMCSNFFFVQFLDFCSVFQYYSKLLVVSYFLVRYMSDVPEVLDVPNVWMC